MYRFKKLFPSKCSVIAMIHVNALPGTPFYKGCIQKIVDKACKETEIYLNNNVNGIAIENMHDIPYIKSKHFGPEIVAVMTKVCTEIKRIVPDQVPCGIQILTGGNREALAVAKACSLNFIRSEGFVFSHVGDEGFIDADAGILLRYRKSIDAENILILTDIKKKHSSHAITHDVSLLETANAAEFFGSDGIILTGISTGQPTNAQELRDLKKCCHLPIIVGSGVTCDNLQDYLDADALIIGSYFKKSGQWRGDVSSAKVKNLTVSIEQKLKELQ